MTEANRFDLSNQAAGDERVGGVRAHVIGAVSREFDASWGRIVPRLSINGATYRSDADANGAQVDATRWIPTFSTDGTFSLERQTQLFGRDLTQTLEPRMLYVLTPYHDQCKLPQYDTAPKDFNEVSIFSENQFTGIDRISDANQLTAGVSTRYNDANNGRELLRLGIAQRLLFKHQQITPDGTPDLHRLSHLLLYGTSSAMEHWSFDGTVELDPSSSTSTPAAALAPHRHQHQLRQPQDVQRAVVSTRYHPGPYKTLTLTYRYTRGSSEQYGLSGQWPVYHRAPGFDRDGGGCGGTLYAVGRADYSVTDSRATYAIGGFEYDAGCWIGRLMFERTSTGRNESTTHLVVQLELNGLSSLGVGSAKILKDNVPGYQPLRDETGASLANPNPQ